MAHRRHTRIILCCLRHTNELYNAIFIFTFHSNLFYSVIFFLNKINDIKKFKGTYLRLSFLKVIKHIIYSFNN